MSDNSKNLSSTKDLKRVLGFWDLMAVGIGSIIGSGIMSLTGWGIDETGRSVCIAFVIGGIIAVLARSPQIFLNSVARFRGGDYSMVGTFLGPPLDRHLFHDCPFDKRYPLYVRSVLRRLCHALPPQCEP